MGHNLEPELVSELPPHWEARLLRLPRGAAVVTCGFDVGLGWGLVALLFPSRPHPRRPVERLAAELGRSLRLAHETGWRKRLHGTVCQELTAARFEIEPALEHLVPEQRESLDRGCSYLSSAAVSLRSLLAEECFS